MSAEKEKKTYYRSIKSKGYSPVWVVLPDEVREKYIEEADELGISLCALVREKLIGKGYRKLRKLYQQKGAD